MELGSKLLDLRKRTIAHREILLTEEAAKTALVLPFLQALGYDVFDPSEVIPEFIADVGTKKGEKVDYAICNNGKVNILIECKPASSELNVNYAAQLFRYFSVTEARLAILTNGAQYLFYSDIEKPNKMDDKPFFSFSIDNLKPTDVKIIEKFTKSAFDIDSIISEAANLKFQSLLRKALETEFAEPSDEFIRMIAPKVHDGRLTPSIRENLGKMMGSTIAAIIRDNVNDRLSLALNASAPITPEEVETDESASDGGIITTPDEISGFHIVQAIASKIVHPKRVMMRDSKSYCAILLDDNNRKTIARLYFNSPTTRYIGLFSGKDEARNRVSDLTDIYQFAEAIEQRIREFDVESVA